MAAPARVGAARGARARAARPRRVSAEHRARSHQPDGAARRRGVKLAKTGGVEKETCGGKS